MTNVVPITVMEINFKFKSNILFLIYMKVDNIYAKRTNSSFLVNLAEGFTFFLF